VSTHITLRQFRHFIAAAGNGSAAAVSRMLAIARSVLTKSMLEPEAELGRRWRRVGAGIAMLPDFLCRP
jgi:hypothetical protein